MRRVLVRWPATARRRSWNKWRCHAGGATVCDAAVGAVAARVSTDITESTNTIPPSATRGQKRIEQARLRGGGRWNAGGGPAAPLARFATTTLAYGLGALLPTDRIGWTGRAYFLARASIHLCVFPL